MTPQLRALAGRRARYFDNTRAPLFVIDAQNSVEGFALLWENAEKNIKTQEGGVLSIYGDRVARCVARARVKPLGAALVLCRVRMRPRVVLCSNTRLSLGPIREEHHVRPSPPQWAHHFFILDRATKTKTTFKPEETRPVQKRD
jgi:hypothetical protein